MHDDFGAEELYRVASENGNIGHAEVRVGDSVVLLFDRAAADEGVLQQGTDGAWLPSPGFLRLYVEDCDAVYQRALEAGATSVTEVADFFSERGGRVRDPLGNLWWIQTHVKDIDAEEMAKLAKGWMQDQGF